MYAVGRGGVRRRRLGRYRAPAGPACGRGTAAAAAAAARVVTGVGAERCPGRSSPPPWSGT